MARRILVVEDEAPIREMVCFVLEQNGFQPVEAEDYDSAVNQLNEPWPDLILLDWMLPGGSGLQFIKLLKREAMTRDIPVVMLTARGEEEDRVRGLETGADDYITKPFNLDILLLRIQKLLQWTQSNHEKFGKMEVSPSEITISSLDEQLIEKAIRIVEENMDNSEFSVEELSAQIGISRSGLYKKLMSITGKSPLEFMRILRLKRGKQLLEKSQLSISQIAYQVGLSPKQFAKYFKEEYGCLPSEYN
mgnify:CR=1 FL=1